LNKATGYIIGVFWIGFIILFTACNPAKKLKEGEYLLNKNHIKGNTVALDKPELQGYIRINPNYKLLGLAKFNLWVYNLANEKRIERKQKKYAEKLQKKNERRLAKGKKLKQRQRKAFGEWLLKIGEAPVAYDSLMVNKSAQQLKLYLNNKGYFLATVKDSIHYIRKRKVNVYYIIDHNKPYKLNKISYDIADNNVVSYIRSDSANCLIKKGNNYDLDVIQEERERITYFLNNQGYYLFTKDAVYFKIDTISDKGKVNVSIGIRNHIRKSETKADSIIEEPHRRFFIKNIYVDQDFSTSSNDSIKLDTINFKNTNGEYKILKQGKLKYKTKVLADAIFIYQNDCYQFKNVEATYKRLSELKAFRYVNISFKELPGDSLDCFIQMSPLLKQSLTTEAEGTNSSGNLGIAGSIIYQNKNLIRGAEVFELKLKGGVAAQKILNEEQKNITTNTPSLNTIEFGPEMNIYVPRFLLPFRVETYRMSNPKTVFTSGLNYQRRPDYFRVITNFALSYTWKESARKRHSISPLMLDFVRVDLTSSFEELLLTQNKFIINSFSNHLNTSTRYSFTYNEQDLTKRKNFSYFRGNLESSGNLLRGIYNITNQVYPNTFKIDEDGRYSFLGIAYSQYLRSDVDYRYYLDIGELGRIVFRIAGGIGKPLTNFKVLPFERSFFSGGANGLRAWQARTIGPGSYSDQTLSYDRFGDGQLEGNIEHRFKIFKMLNGAIFVDAGNVWLQKQDTTRLGGDFKLSRFYKEIAIGTGLGVRADFNFFIIRLDMGIKAYDPQFAESERWVLPHLFSKQWKQDYKDTYDTKYNFATFNLGIGYPF
jgi:outer membrane translocation and assembly module TamA